MATINEKFFADLASGASWAAGVSFQRSNPLPLDKYSVFPSIADAQAYAATNPVAYPGQIIAVLNNNQMEVYVLAQEQKINEETGKTEYSLKLQGMSNNNTGGVVVLRRDNDYNYKKVENTLIPAYGEVCLVDVAGYGLRAKVGDGVSTFAQLPYTDEVIMQNIDSLITKGYYYQGKFYTDAAHTTLMEDKIGRIYIDAINSRLYTYNGTAYETQNGSLPNASAELAGAMKLYDEVGQNIDGTMTQRAITNELNEKFEMDVVEEEEMVVFDIDID